MKIYTVAYRMYQFDDVKTIQIKAKSMPDAYSEAVFKVIPEIEGEQVYSAWVDGYTTKDSRYVQCNTFEGKPY